MKLLKFSLLLFFATIMTPSLFAQRFCITNTGICPMNVCAHLPNFGPGSCGPPNTCTYTLNTDCQVAWGVGDLHGNTPVCFDDPTINSCFGCLGLHLSDFWITLQNVGDWTHCECKPCNGAGGWDDLPIVTIRLDHAPGYYSFPDSKINVYIPPAGVLAGIQVYD